MSIFHTVTPEWLAQHMTAEKQKSDFQIPARPDPKMEMHGCPGVNSVVILDVTYEKRPKPNPEEFMKTRYGRFEEMMREKPRAYVEEHIPGAVLFNIDAAFYPSKYIRFDLYPPEVFERYMRLLGVNNDDHVIVYGRGPFAGMMWPAKAWWALKVYGHGKVSVLDGGLDAWKKAGYPVTNQVVQRRPGNFTAKPLDDSYLVTFEELDKKNRNGKSLFDELNTINYLDARPSGQFHGTEPLEVPAPGATGAHLKGAKNVPLVNVISQNGLKTKEEISHGEFLDDLTLKRAGYRAALPVITACNTGVQAALLALVLETVKIKARVYNGSMAEIGLRAPQLINQK